MTFSPSSCGCEQFAPPSTRRPVEGDHREVQADGPLPCMPGSVKAWWPVRSRGGANACNAWSTRASCRSSRVTDPLQLGFARQGDDRHPHRRHPQAGRETVRHRRRRLRAGTDRRILRRHLARVSCEDDDSLLELLNTQIRSLPGVITTETLVYLKLVKQQYNWGNAMTIAGTRTNHLHHRSGRQGQPPSVGTPRPTREGITPPIITRGEGVRIFDDKGKSYIDGLSGLSSRSATAARNLPRPPPSKPRNCPSSRCGPTPRRRPSNWPNASPTTPPAT